MMTKTWFNRLSALTLGVALSAGSAAWAGQTLYIGDVLVDDINGEASGLIAHAGGRQGIGCDIATTRDAGGQLAQRMACRAEDAFGVVLGCTSAKPQFVRLVRLVRSRSVLRFSIGPGAVADSAAPCQSLTVEVSSAVTLS